jgi:heterodisulfide reductase subunit A
MDQNERIGIIFCDPPDDYPQKDITELVKYARDQLMVPVIIEQTKYLFSDFHVLQETIKQHRLTSIILAGIHPERFLTMLRKAMMDSGLPANSAQAAHLESIWLKNTLPGKKVFDVLKRVHNEIASKKPRYENQNPDTLVIGGGIAGIQASLEIANAGLKVHLVEKSGTIGGHMAMFDKTFPTLDCAACILTPKMVEVGQDENIEMHTYSEVIDVSGEPGNFTVRIKHKARKVNIKTCIGCGTCAEKCPSKTSSEFDSGTTLRKAIYIPFPQAVPNKYLIDSDSCRYVKDGKCGVCVKVCPVDKCIDLDEKDEVVEVKVGHIIVATGFKLFDATKITQYGYGKLPNVLTSIEFERLINAAGPTGGDIVYRTQDKKGNWIFEKGSQEPKKVGIIHCVGSRDENHNSHCSKVCCMYSLKLAHLVKEKLPDAEVYEYYIDMRAFGKGYEEFYNRIKEEGIHIIRGRTAQINEVNGQMIMRSEDLIQGRLIEQDVDMVILSVGLEPRTENPELAKMLGIEVDTRGWFEPKFGIANPVGTISPGIQIAGVCQGPKDIPDTVAEASAAAAGVIQDILSGRIHSSDFQKQEIPNLEKIS